VNSRKRPAISRREFARRAAMASAASFVPVAAVPVDRNTFQPPPSPEQDQSQLSPQSQAEAEARYQAILAGYGARFNEEQKKELRRLSFSVQPSLDRLRAYPLENADAPALYLKPLVEREKKPEAKATGAAPSRPSQKP
jgi:hypothetical protein